MLFIFYKHESKKTSIVIVVVEEAAAICDSMNLLGFDSFLVPDRQFPGVVRICIQIIATLRAKQYEEYSNRRPPSLVYATSTVRAQFWNATTTDGILRGRFRNSKVVRLKFLQFYGPACAIDYAVVPGQIFEIIYAV